MYNMYQPCITNCSVSVSLATVQRDDHPEQDDRIIMN